ncbi:hypothetical protein BDV95DRAFT_613118 [Massariosphaeria phaeospora]|uniref:Uncharacterized protein n=1 Tax=Massariosphaeria phaeospora TaxID=100035 RepID=A0A7C8I5L2_9PLEO|nr:hypothetical protein BDV95DRAFT_613118 [Massariosphaeria phaeospora]
MSDSEPGKEPAVEEKTISRQDSAILNSEKVKELTLEETEMELEQEATMPDSGKVEEPTAKETEKTPEPEATVPDSGKVDETAAKETDKIPAQETAVPESGKIEEPRETTMPESGKGKESTAKEADKIPKQETTKPDSGKGKEPAAEKASKMPSQELGPKKPKEPAAEQASTIPEQKTTLPEAGKGERPAAEETSKTLRQEITMLDYVKSMEPVLKELVEQQMTELRENVKKQVSEAAKKHGRVLEGVHKQLLEDRQILNQKNLDEQRKRREQFTSCHDRILMEGKKLNAVRAGADLEIRQVCRTHENEDWTSYLAFRGQPEKSLQIGTPKDDLLKALASLERAVKGQLAFENEQREREEMEREEMERMERDRMEREKEKKKHKSKSIGGTYGSKTNSGQPCFKRHNQKPKDSHNDSLATMAEYGLSRDSPSSQGNRQNALAEIQFASIADADLTPSEDETTDAEEKALQLETVQSAIGVSIGQQQTRLASPLTPAAEKAAALDDVDGGAFFDGWNPLPDEPLEQSLPAALDGQNDERKPRASVRDVAPQSETHDRLPSPWRAAPRTFQRVDDHRAALRDTFIAAPRRRALSGSATEAFKKYMPFNLPSMRKSSSFLSFSLPSFSVSSLDNARGRTPPGTVSKSKRVSSSYGRSTYGAIAQLDGSDQSRIESNPRLPQPRHPATAPTAQHDFGKDTGRSPTPVPPSLGLFARPPPNLRKSNSEGSLLLYRNRSIASSLGDDSRFENVQESVNSRLKAIRDSWQDSNFRFPSMPTMPNFNFGPREDMFRSGSSKPPPGFAANANTPFHDRVTFHTNARRSAILLTAAKTKNPSAEATNSRAASAATHPFFTKATEELTGDLVIMGGYRGSILRSAEPPHRQLWVPFKVGLNLRRVDLEVGLYPEDEETEEQRVIPGGMLSNIGPVDISRRLLKRLRASENVKNGTLRIYDYGYDWRLSPHLLSRRLVDFLKALPCNQPGVPHEQRGATVLAHSLGGLITRHAVNQRPELFAGVIYAGVPQTCVNILGPLRNGDDVLLSSRVLTAQVNFTIRTSYALLPLNGKCFINKYTKEEYRVDFFDPKNWSEYRLSPCIKPPIPANTQKKEQPNLSVTGLLSAMSSAIPSFPSLPSRKSQTSTGPAYSDSGPVRDVAHNAVHAIERAATSSGNAISIEPHMTSTHKDDFASAQPNPATAVTIPHDKAVEYLARTLAEVKQFKLELAHQPAHTAANMYPPVALIYGKSTPTVYGAKVESREAIKRSDAYDELVFASGDGVVLAKAAMVPEGYAVVSGGAVSSDRGHVTMLGDLEAVGKCLYAVIAGRRRGVGLGVEGDEDADAVE